MKTIVFIINFFKMLASFAKFYLLTLDDKTAKILNETIRAFPSEIRIAKTDARCWCEIGKKGNDDFKVYDLSPNDWKRLVNALELAEKKIFFRYKSGTKNAGEVPNQVWVYESMIPNKKGRKIEKN